MNSVSDPLLIVTGPTASGKTSLSIDLAKQLNGEVISVDSAQVYRHFNIGTDKISAVKRQIIPHHCIDILEPQEQCNAFTWLQTAYASATGLRAIGKLPLFVGGTTLYISALIEGLSELPPGNSALRTDLETLSTPELFARAEKFHVAGTINPNDRLRLIRAIEIHLSTPNDNSAAWPGNRNALILVLTKDRDLLYQGITDRVAAMLDIGLIEEASALYQRYGGDTPAFRTLGYSQCRDLFEGRIAQADLQSAIAQASRRYAKRQLTFWRNEPFKRGWLQIPDQRTAKTTVLNSSNSFDSFSLTATELGQRIAIRLLEPFEMPEVWYITITEK